MNPVFIAPTTLMDVPPLEYIDYAARAGYDGLGLRLYPSPGMPFFPIVGDADLEAKVRKAVADSRLPVYEIYTCYLTGDMDIEAMRRAHEYGASLGAKFALVIGDDEDWGRMVHNFGTLCDNAKQYNLICALEAPVGSRKLNTFGLNKKVIEEAGRDNVGLSVDPSQFIRSGGTVDDLKATDPKLFPYCQINDTVHMERGKPGQPLCMPGEGLVPLGEMIDAWPKDIPLSLEYHYQWSGGAYTREEWAKHALDGTRAFLAKHEASKA
jgi:sugar phosphate isomerase/epimerase